MTRDRDGFRGNVHTQNMLRTEACSQQKHVGPVAATVIEDSLDRMRQVSDALRRPVNARLGIEFAALAGNRQRFCQILLVAARETIEFSRTQRPKANPRTALCVALNSLPCCCIIPFSITIFFVSWDDDAYVTDNPHVRTGLTASNVGWSFTSFEQSNWHPLTWLSHMLDCQLLRSH